MQAVYYRDPFGHEPVKAFIDALSPEIQDELDWHIDLLNALTETSPPLAFPLSSQVDGELRELRCPTVGLCIAFSIGDQDDYSFCFTSLRSAAVPCPKADIDIATARWRDFQGRMNSARRSPPRPAGHDAPS
jgi:hypothetical protein